ncbi:MAG: TetR/AcrR family transcriptional regulator [Clostridia bacterium]|nr:TetR/AcrR family transcriptional regulator [Clostridia bacterium]MBQ3995408.1 TetR/AcrR family transcriptional regulator [Clostridia bacterium]
MTKNLRETIFRESVRLWDEKGYENVSMRDIAAACNIGTGNLTYYFPKKDDILMFYHDKVMDYAEDMIAGRGDELSGLSGYFAVEYMFMYYIVFFVNELYKQVINVPALRRRYYAQHHKLYRQFTGKEMERSDWAATVAMCNMEYGLTDVDLLEGEFDTCMEKILETRFIMDKRKPSGWKAELEKGMTLGRELVTEIRKSPPVIT